VRLSPKKLAVAGAISVAAAYLLISYLAPSIASLGVPKTGSYAPEARAALLDRTRQSCQVAHVSNFIEEQRQLVDSHPQNPAQKRVLAYALLERVTMRGLWKGMKPGALLYTDPPEDIVRDVEEALELVRAARTMGDETSENYRLESSLLPFKATNWGAALLLLRTMTNALKKAMELDPSNPKAQLVIGGRKLYSPSYLGQDLEKAIEHLEFAGKALPLDERPLIFASHAYYLLGRRDKAIELLEKAIARTPSNYYATTARERIRAGEDKPFERDMPRPTKEQGR